MVMLIQFPYYQGQLGDEIYFQRSERQVQGRSCLRYYMLENKSDPCLFSILQSGQTTRYRGFVLKDEQQSLWLHSGYYIRKVTDGVIEMEWS